MKKRSPDTRRLSAQMRYAAILLLIVCISFSRQSLAQVSGTVFRDFNANGSKGTSTPNLEPGAQGIIVNAFNTSDVLIASYTTGSSGTYSIPASGSTYNGTLGSNTGSVAAGAKVRLEFVIPTAATPNCNLDKSFDYSGYQGSVYGTNVQFITGGAANVNFAINNPENYASTTNPKVYVPVAKNGDPLGGGTTGTSGAIVSFNYTASGTAAPNNLVKQSAVGSVWGLAYSKQADRLFAAASLKRHCGFGPLGSGGIYKIDPSANDQVVQFYNMDANGYYTRCNTGCATYGSGTSYSLSGSNTNTVSYIGNGLGVIGTNIQRGLPSGLGSPSRDPAAFGQIGKAGLGGIDVSEDGKYLYVINLFDQKLYVLTLNDALNPTSVTAVSSFSLPNPPLRSTWEIEKNGSATTYTGGNNSTGFYDGTKGVQRPFAVTYHKGKVYIGSVTTGENGGVATVDNNSGAPEYTDLFAYVWSFDGTSFSSTPVLQFPLNYGKGITTTFSDCPTRSNWLSWINSMESMGGGSGASKLTYPQPILGNIEFDVNGNMILGFIDRAGNQVGARNYGLNPGSSSLYENFNGGDILKALPNSSCNWRIEASADRNSTQNDGEGPGGGEFYYNDNNGETETDHEETALGGLALLAGTNQVMSAVFDPQTDFNCAGVKSFNNTSGASDNEYQIYASGSGNPPSDGTWLKGGGLGDVAFFEDLPCTEVGNRVWNDTDGDGIQDADESGISGVIVELYASNGTTLLGSATTNSSGNYYLNCSNINQNGATGITPATSYILKISSTQFNNSGSGALSGLNPTGSNVTGNGQSDWSDNDGVLNSGRIQISFTSGNQYGDNNHSLDFGFRACNVQISATHSDVSCFAGNNGSIDVTVTGAQGGITFLWNDGATSEDRSGLAAGTYTVTATDGSNCTATTTVTVNQPAAALSVGMSGTDVTITGGNDGTATANPSGGTPAYTYLWSNGQTTQTATGLTAGAYTVTVTDAHGCSASNSIDINQPSCSVSLEVTGTDALCHGDSNGTIDLTVSGAQSGNVSYLWNDGATTEDRTGLSAGSYTVTVTDGNTGCTATTSFTVGEPAVLGMSGSVNDVTITGGNDGSVDVTTSGGTSPYSYLWNDGATTEDRTGLSAGSYTVTVTDANGCSHEETFTVNEPGCTVSLEVTGTDALCHGDSNGTIDLTVSGAQSGNVSYLWNDGATTEDRTGLSAGSYTVTVTDGNTGCTATTSFTVGEPAVLGMSGSVNDVTITGGNDGSVDVTTSGGTSPYSYLWNDGATTEDRTGLSAGSYTVTVTDANGCSHEETFTVNEPGCTVSLEVTGTDALCHGDSNGAIDLTVSGAQSGNVSYLWNDGATTEDRTGLSAGSYTVTVTDGNTGCTATTSFTVGEPAVLGMSGSVNDVTITGGNDGSVDVTTSGGTSPYSYLWNDGATTEDRTGLSAGSYTVTVTDANGCSHEETFTVNEPGCTVSLEVTGTDALCHGDSNGTIDLTVSGAQSGNVSYLWNDGATTEDRTGLSAGSYTVTVTDGNTGCTATTSFTVGEPAVLGMSGSVNDVTITGGSDGSINVTVSGGTAPYSYLWSDGSTDEDRTGLTSGSYTVTVSDANGCSHEETFTVNEPGCDIDMSGIVNEASCHGVENGSIDLNVTGAQGMVSYLWNDGATTEERTELAAGTYTVTATDEGGCQVTLSFTLNDPEVLDVSGSVNDVTITGGNDGSVDVTTTGGTSPYSYLWNDGATTEDRTGLTAGTYTVTVTDDNGCYVQTTFTVNDVECTIIVDAGPDVEKCHNDPTMLTALASDPGASYSWSPVDGLDNPNIANPTTNVKETTTYTVTVTGTDGCMATDEVTVTVAKIVKAQIVVKPNTPACEAPNVKLATKNNPNYSYEWRLNGLPIIGAADKNTYCASVSGDYSVHVTDLSSGCMHTSKKVAVVIEAKLEGDAMVSEKSTMNFSAWPNPTADQLYITLSNTTEGIVKVQLIDMFGRQVMATDLGGSKEEQTIRFNMNELSAGMYIVSVLNGDNRMDQKVMLIK